MLAGDLYTTQPTIDLPKRDLYRQFRYTRSENVNVNDVVTDWSHALAGFLVSMLFGVSSGQS